MSELIRPNDFEATAILHQLETSHGAPPVLFNRVESLAGEEAGYRMLFNTYSRRTGVSAALGLTTNSWEDLLETIPARSNDLRAPQQSDNAPVQTSVVRGADVKLSDLPWTRHVEMEGRSYFTPILAARQPGSERYNLSWNRVMYLDETHAGVHISPRQL
ncbi:MAG TPA: UbiD family decarboxylase domain-containing protein, partial [Propionibacteriaceae bacterium]|nr:UbiD family decarboxylase domain-containing protein [Propionibacteriaceae bacterium]